MFSHRQIFLYIFIQTCKDLPNVLQIILKIVLKHFTIVTIPTQQSVAN